MAEYIEQLKQVELAISLSTGETREELISLKKSIKELLDLSDNADSHSNNNTNKNSLTDEYALFMAEMDTKGVLLKKSESSPSLNEISDVIQNNSHISLQESFGEGKKCRAPHRHQWGDVVYHNALISSVISDHTGNQAKILFTNPTHQEMLPCPFLFNDSDCKFSDEKCRFSHGEMVSLSSLQEYVEPDFELLTIGSRVLAKKKSNLWHCAIIKALHEDKCLVKFESDRQEIELQLENVFPLFGNGQNESSSDYSDSENEIDNENVINMSLLNNVSDQVLGQWEKHTKGIGSKLMQKMGYVIGTGLGKRSDGILNPVTAVILPSGKSLDHCMQLREIAGGDKNLFSVERRMKHLKKKQELQRKKSYEREKSKTDVFNFMNNSLLDNQGPDTKRTNTKLTKSQHRLKIKRESCRNLNVVSMKIDEDIRKVERELFVIKESLSRHKDVNSQMHKSLKGKLGSKETELTSLKVQAQNIKLEQNLRNDKKKLTVF